MKNEKFDNPHEIVTSSVPIFFFIWDVQEKKVIYVSKKFYDLAEDTTPLRHEKNLKDYFDPSFHEQYERFFDALSLKNDYSNKLEIKTSDLLKDVKWIDIRTFPVDESIRKRNGEVELVVGHLIDITDRKEKISFLEGENRNFDNMMQMISHDLRQPFTKIALLAEMILMSEVENKEVNTYASKIKEVTQAAHQLLEHSLQLAALNYSNQMLSTTSESLGTLIRETVEEFDTELKDRDITISLNLPEENYTYPIHRLFFKQLLKNLLSNAIKFTPAGGSIVVKLSTHKNSYKIDVTDTGIGIPEEIKSKLFREVTAVRRTGLDGQKSTGLGLAISKRIAELHHGTITFESEEGKGSTFTILLPLEPHLS